MTRQEILKKINELGGREEFILSEMKRLGFWDTSQGIPQIKEQLREERKALEDELKEALQKQALYRNKKKMLREIRQKRMAEAKLRRAATRENRLKQKAEKAAAHKAAMEQDIEWLGPGVSAGLLFKTANQLRLETLGLPVIEHVAALVAQIKLSANELRFLAYDKKVSKICHYQRFKIAKKTGGFREISAPGPRLKTAQHWIRTNILDKVALHQGAHGFVPGRSIVSNAQPHIGADVVINMDLKDFFPSINYKRVKGVFVSLGYSEQIATIFALICTEPQTEQVSLDNQKYFVAKGERRLPQGAPTSPAITNILCTRMDRRFEGVAQSLGWTYTRYADDLTFSKKGAQPSDISRILWQSKLIVENEGFVLHPNKIKVMRKGRRQEVTGVVVNEKLNISREKLKQFRAVLHKIEKEGLATATFGNGNTLEAIQGFANYVLMVNPAKGKVFKKQVAEILKKVDPALRQSQPHANTTKNKIEIQVTNHSPAPEWWKMF